jgi:hypothetical protein
VRNRRHVADPPHVDAQRLQRPNRRLAARAGPLDPHFESKDRNVRHDAIRSLLNGFAGAMSLTTAHECGHLGGLGHDTVTPRSIMNVADAKGLDPESGEWIPDHIAQLERTIGREPEPKR